MQRRPTQKAEIRIVEGERAAGGRQRGRAKSRRTRNTTSRDNLIFSNFIRCASIKIQPACRLDIVIPLVYLSLSLAQERKTERGGGEKKREKKSKGEGERERMESGCPTVVDQTPPVVEHLSSFRGRVLTPE